MANHDHLNQLMQGIDAWNGWRHANPDVKPDLRRANLKDANLTKADLSNSDLKNSILEGAVLTETDLSNTKLNGAHLDKAKLKNADLTGADIRGAIFYGANLEEACLYGVDADARTRFVDEDDDKDDDKYKKSVRVKGCKIDRYVFGQMAKHGGLHAENRALMQIKNDLAQLRNKYSGLFFLYNLTVVGVWLLPYVFFLVRQYSVASFCRDKDLSFCGERAPINGKLSATCEICGYGKESSISLLEALGRYIFNGGIRWEVEWSFHFSFVLFVTALTYNVFRGALLWKTLKLEHSENVSAISERFSFSFNTRWALINYITDRLFWPSILAVALNTIYFLSQRISVS